MLKTEGAPSAAPQSRTASRPILIAIPFYKNEHLVSDVVGSLIHCAKDLQALGAEVVLYDDSPDYALLGGALTTILPQAAAAFPCRIVRNEVNLGFVQTMNQAVTEAIARRFDLLMLNSDTKVEPGALVEMARISRLDPMIGFVNPRSNNAAIATLPLAPRFDGSAPTREAYQALAAMLPEFSYAPVAVGFCMLIRWNIIATFGGFDEIYGAGYNEENDLVMRAARCGYRAVFANHAFVWHEGEQSFSIADLSREHWEPTNRAILDRRYPEYSSYTGAYYTAPETLAETLLAALIRDQDGRLDFAFDFSSFSPSHNGTFKNGLQLLTAARQVLGDLFNIYVLCSQQTFDFFNYGKLGAQRRDPHGQEKFAIIFRVGQPYDWNDLERLTMKGAVIGIYMLDTISIDSPHLTSPRLFNLWQFALEQCDVVAALSQMTLTQLRNRFHIPEQVVVPIVLQSFDLEDYHIAGMSGPAQGNRTLLVLGNHYQHKYMAPTANALASAFPDRSIIALGQDKPEQERNFERYAPQHLSQAVNLTGVGVGNLDETDVGTFYTNANAIVFPSHYEGFGMPILHALAAQRPIFVRTMPVFEEIWRELKHNPNIHFYETTDELIEKLRTIPQWQVTPVCEGNGAARALSEIRGALDTARGRITFHRIVERLRAVQFINDAGAFRTPQSKKRFWRRRPRKPLPKIGAVLRLDGPEFVRKAYLAVLHREADPDGVAHYVERLQGKGHEEKINILRTLSGSAEARALGVQFSSLWLRIAYDRLRRIVVASPPADVDQN